MTNSAHIARITNLDGIDMAKPLQDRPVKVVYLVGDYSKAERTFGCEPKMVFNENVKMMVELIIEQLKNRQQ